jgi:ATP-dependent Clp protease ATP-binding subunit ClpA
LTEPVVDYLAEKGYDHKMGARPLSRKIDEIIRVPLSRRILFDRLENCSVTARMVDDQVVFDVESVLSSSLDSNNIIQLPRQDDGV